MPPLDIVIPVYNESVEVVQRIISALKTAFKDRDDVTIIVVDDGSDAKFELGGLGGSQDIVFLRHEVNMGYGTALKTGIRAGSAPWIAITDADETYPPEALPGLVKDMENADMVVGSRIGEVVETPLMRRVPKRMLNLLASYMAGVPIRDLNSGMRVFSRKLCYRLWGLLPRRFSFTSTMTMGLHLGGYRVLERPINYYKRVGTSSILPIRDTVRFLHVIVRMGVLFHPMKLFLPVALALFAVGAGKGFLRDFPMLGYIGNFAVTLMLTAVQVLLMGYLGELIVSNRMLTYHRDVDPDQEDSN
jgi:glycosyltransferase involved in cell wall biosynthesis